MNGLGSQLEVLEPLVDQLPPDLEVIRFDVPGVGGSPAPVLPYHYAMLASLVGALVRRLGHDRVDVLGFSWGGGLAQQFAVTQAGKCRRLVLASTATGAVMVPARPRVLGHMLTPRRHRDPARERITLEPGQRGVLLGPGRVGARTDHGRRGGRNGTATGQQGQRGNDRGRDAGRDPRARGHY
jgi:pimeloyl-ACP methyl ester carboxylesterase